MRLEHAELERMREVIQRLCGVSLDASKGYLIETRLGAIARRAGCETFSDLHEALLKGRDQALVREVIAAITTHETTWFRDGAPFKALQNKILPSVFAERRHLGQERTLRIWSAACSTGQEPYSIAMVLHEMLPDVDEWNIEIVATDISRATLEEAQQGRFSRLAMSRTTRPQMMTRYFEPDGDKFRIADRIRRLVKFRELNLLRPFAGLGSFDVVFLRNVLIYFDQDDRKHIVQRITKCMRAYAWLILGASESLVESHAQCTPELHCGAALYRPNASVVR